MLNGRYDSALYYTDEAAALMRGITGENNLQYAGMLYNLSVSHFYLGNFKKAKYYILKEVTLRESLKTNDDPGYITSLENASIICRRSGDYEEALTQVKKAEKKSLKVYGAHSPAYAKTVSCYAGVCYDMGCSVNDMVYLKQGEEYLKKAESIYLSNGEKSKSAIIINKSDQAAYHNDIGNLPMAESMLQEVVSSCENEYGPSSTNYASALNNLAVLYYNIGDYKLAEKFFVEAVDIYTKSPEAKSIQTGICINNLGALYHDMGNYSIAARLVADAQKILENDAQQNNPAFAVVLNNLASVYLSEEYYANQENKSRERLLNSGKILLKADSVFKINCQMPHPYGFAIMNNLALWYNFTGNKKKSVQMFYDLTSQSNISFRILAMMNKMGISGEIPITGEQQTHPALEPLIIPIKINLVDQVMASNADFNSNGASDGITRKMVEWILGKATNLKKAVGPYHPAYAEVLKSLIVSYASNDDVAAEEELTLEYINVINHKTLRDFPSCQRVRKNCIIRPGCPIWILL